MLRSILERIIEQWKLANRVPAGHRQWRQINKNGARFFHLAKVIGVVIFQNRRQMKPLSYQNILWIAWSRAAGDKSLEHVQLRGCLLPLTVPPRTD